MGRLTSGGPATRSTEKPAGTVSVESGPGTACAVLEPANEAATIIRSAAAWNESGLAFICSDDNGKSPAGSQSGGDKKRGSRSSPLFVLNSVAADLSRTGT